MSSRLAEAHNVLRDVLGQRLGARSGDWFVEQMNALADNPQQLLRTLPLASRYAKNTPLAPTADERARMQAAIEGLEIERWTELEGLRVALLTTLGGQEEPAFAELFEETFRYADEGEQRALFRALPMLPGPERFLWRAGEGCRTNIVPVFESVAADSPYPVEHFDEVAWNQLCLKAVFIGAPLHRVWGLDSRLNPELSRMALDLVDERRSAGRAVQPELWLCLGTHAGDRGLAAMDHELAAGAAVAPEGRRAALLALARAGHAARVAEFVSDADPAVASAARSAQDAVPTSAAFAPQS